MHVYVSLIVMELTVYNVILKLHVYTHFSLYRIYDVFLNTSKWKRMKRKTGTESGKAESGNDVMYNLHMCTALSHLSTSALHSISPV